MRIAVVMPIMSIHVMWCSIVVIFTEIWDSVPGSGTSSGTSASGYQWWWIWGVQVSGILVYVVLLRTDIYES
jgi:hypothetical protein